MKLDFDKVMKNFPLAKPRDIQVQALKDICNSFNNGAEYVVAEVPVGGGKSAIALALARTMGRSYILTLTEQLQEQYLHDFRAHGLEALKGRGKFTCGRLGGDSTCADGKLELEGNNACPPELCGYQVAKARAFAAPHCVANYHSYVYNVGMGMGLPKRKKGQGRSSFDFDNDEVEVMRDLTVCDEAHFIENLLLDVVSVNVKLEKLPFTVAPPPDERFHFEPYKEYLKGELLPKLVKYLEVGTKRQTLDAKTRDELESLNFKLGQVLLHAEDEQWVPEREEAKDKSGRLLKTSFALKPLYVRRYNNWVLGNGRQKLLMSGTILDAHKLVTSLGLDPDKGDALVYDSPFPKENRPVYVGNLGMTMKDRDVSWPLMVEMTVNILEHHAKDKGLLLCPSNAMIDYIIKALPAKHARRMLKASGDNRMAKYHEHIASKEPTVLAAPGFWEGADLKGDSSVFQIIPAIPRAFWAGQVEARAKADPGWYDWVNMTKLLQGFGRSVRSDTDVAVTYLFDKGFRTELKKPRSLVPKWVRDSVQLVD